MPDRLSLWPFSICDARSPQLIVTYDHHRGEPRGHGKPVY